MIGLFPEPMPDETIQSVYARRADLFDIPRGKLMESVGGRAPFDDHHSKFDFIGGLIGEGRDFHQMAIRLLNENSYIRYNNLERNLYGYADLNEHSLRCMGDIAFWIPYCSSKKVPRFLQYCPDCVDEDRRASGFCWWRRTHQLPGVFVCPLHSTTLYASTERQSPYFARARSLEVALEAGGEPLIDEVRPGLVEIARQSMWTLANRLAPLPATERVAKIMKMRRYNAGQNRGRWRSTIHRSLIQFYGSSILEKMPLPYPDSERPYQWPGDAWIEHQNRSGTLFYIALFAFLGRHVSALYCAHSRLSLQGLKTAAGGISQSRPQTVSAAT